MQFHQLQALQKAAAEAGPGYLEFLRVPDLSMGLYSLEAGSKDPQQPHNEDEVYWVLKGRAKLQVGEESLDVAEGAIIYVPAQAPHKFFAIREDLQVLVFFAPAES